MQKEWILHTKTYPDSYEEIGGTVGFLEADFETIVDLNKIDEEDRDSISIEKYLYETCKASVKDLDGFDISLNGIRYLYRNVKNNRAEHGMKIFIHSEHF